MGETGNKQTLNFGIFEIEKVQKYGNFPGDPKFWYSPHEVMEPSAKFNPVKYHRRFDYEFFFISIRPN